MSERGAEVGEEVTLERKLQTSSVGTRYVCAIWVARPRFYPISSLDVGWTCTLPSSSGRIVPNEGKIFEHGGCIGNGLHKTDKTQIVEKQ